ncbi:hypothetical protein ABH898_002542 [Paenibacillus sp. RC82]
MYRFLFSIVYNVFLYIINERGFVTGLLFTYVLLGFSIALPVGTITVEMTKQGLKNGFMHGWIVGLGGMKVNFITKRCSLHTKMGCS